MPNTVEVAFVIDQPGTARATLREIDNLMTKVGTSATKTGTQIDSAVGGDRVLLRKFDMAARQLNEATTGANRLGGSLSTVAQRSQQGAENLNRVQNALFNISGIPASPAIEQLLNLSGAAPGIGLLVASVGALGAVVNKITGDILKMNEGLRDMAAKSNQLKFRPTGGLDQSIADLERLRKIIKEVDELNKAGAISDAAALQRREFGRGLTGSELRSLEAQALRRVERFGGEDPRVAAERQRFQEEQKKRTDAFNQESQLKMEMQDREFAAAEKLRRQEQERHRARMEQLQKENEQFQRNVGDELRRASLLGEAEKLRAGLGGEDLRARVAEIDQQRAEAFARIQEARGPGGDEAERRKALDEFTRLSQGSVRETLERAAKDREIAALKANLEAANTPAKQAYLLDQLLAATSNIGGLTPEQVETRAQAIEQRIGLVGKEQVHTVEITLIDESRGAMKAELGETPTPATSGTFSDLYRSAQEVAGVR